MAQAIGVRQGSSPRSICHLMRLGLPVALADAVSVRSPSGRRSDQKARWARHLSARCAGSDGYISAHLSAFSRRHSSLYCGPKGARISSERSTISPRRTKRDGSARRSRRRQFVFRLLQLHARNCSVLDRRVQLLHVVVYASPTRERANRAAEPPAGQFGTLALPAHSRREARH